MVRKSSKEVELHVDEILEVLADRAQEAHENAERFQTEEQIRQNLAALGGKMRDDDDIAYEGKKIILPEQTTIRQNIRFLEKKEEEMEKSSAFSQTFNYRPWDGAMALWNVLKEQFGGVGHKGTMGFFGPNPPEMRSIPIAHGKSEQVPWGTFSIASLPDCSFETSGEMHREKGVLFQITAVGPKKYRFEIQGIFNLVETYLANNSIYRGKAFDGQQMPEFLNVWSYDADQIVYSDEVVTQLEANVWSQLRYTDEFRKHGKALKRAVLLHGPYGTGKTLACMLTAQEADRAGWTFIQARAGRDELGAVLQTAKLYQPSVVFFEDIDTIAGSEEEGISKLLDDFDGMGAKGTEILMVLTTNHRDKLHKGMARPGRLDAMIEINELDQHGVEKLVRTRINDLLAPDIDWAAVFVAAEGYKPAFVTEGADRTFRYLLARNGSLEGQKVETVDLVFAMQGLRDQYDLMTGAKDAPHRDSLTEELSRIMERQIQSHRVDFDESNALVPIDS